jgi:signal transduction histidine kinase
MSLQVKFLLLVGTLVLAVVGSLTAAWWTLRIVHTEVASPFRSVTHVLAELGQIKRHAERIASELGEPWGEAGGPAVPAPLHGVQPMLADRASTEDKARAVLASVEQARTQVLALGQDDRLRHNVGLSTWNSIRMKVDAMDAGVRGWADGAGHDSRAAALRACWELHELIESTELRILENARRAVEYSDQLSATLAWWLASVFLAAALTGLLAVVLLRRWVQRPVADLRRAALRIGAGDFSHRIPVSGRDEIGQLVGEVNHMAAMVDRLLREAVDRERYAAVGQMVRRIVHNLRNPLAGIRGLAEITRLDLPDPSEGRDNLTLIVSTVDSFDRWLTELLDSTKPLVLHKKPTVLVPWVQSVVLTYLPSARAKGVGIEVESHNAPELVDMDARHLDHALAAVIANAIDAAPPGSVVRVTVAGAPSPEQFEVSVVDCGSGVPPHLRDRIFEPHFTTKANGTGIGLAIAQQIVRAHGGLITYEDAPRNGSASRGAVFRIRLPVTTVQSERPPVAESSRSTG